MTEADPMAPLRREELRFLFTRAEVPDRNFRLGAESEKFGVHRGTGRPLGYGEEFGVCRVLEHLMSQHGWSPVREVAGGPVIALSRGEASITLEPGGQLELSGAALRDLHAIAAEQTAHLEELSEISERLQIAWLGTGFHPTARQDQLPWVPKQRYPIMREYLPTRGSGALDMMRRTATVQLNFDWQDERDGMRKLVLALKLSPVINALFSNSPFEEGKFSGFASRRGRVWLHMDPSRSGLLDRLWHLPAPTYEDYIEWTLDAGMFFIRRGEELILNTGQTFRDFLTHGFDGHHAVWTDWESHLKTLFPEVRLKSTLEVRSVDCLPPELGLASMAVWVGLLHDPAALERAEALVRRYEPEQMREARPELVRRGLAGPVLGRDGFSLAAELLDIARAGLEQRAADSGIPSEAPYLAPIQRLVSLGRHPADEALARARETDSAVSATTINRTDAR